ncbi:hypothetical protein GCM10027456_58590 [Kineosporia babensis]
MISTTVASIGRNRRSTGPGNGATLGADRSGALSRMPAATAQVTAQVRNSGRQSSTAPSRLSPAKKAIHDPVSSYDVSRANTELSAARRSLIIERRLTHSSAPPTPLSAAAAKATPKPGATAYPTQARA